MNTPSWDELVDRNIAAERTSFSGHLSVIVHDHGISFEERFTFWHHAGCWRIESDGETLYVAGADGPPVVYFDGKMRRQYPGHFRMWIGTSFEPLDLLGRDSLLDDIPSDMCAAGPCTATDVGGRSAWSASLAPLGGGDPIELAFDDATGLIVRFASEGEVVFEVTDLVGRDDFPGDLFRWEGPVAADDDLDEEVEDPLRQNEIQIEILEGIVAALDHPDEVTQIMATISDSAEKLNALTKRFDITELGAHAAMNPHFRHYSVGDTRAMRDELEFRKSKRPA